jgi:hypothetical protein
LRRDHSASSQVVIQNPWHQSFRVEIVRPSSDRLKPSLKNLHSYSQKSTKLIKQGELEELEIRESTYDKSNTS